MLHGGSRLNDGLRTATECKNAFSVGVADPLSLPAEKHNRGCSSRTQIRPWVNNTACVNNTDDYDDARDLICTRRFGQMGIPPSAKTGTLLGLNALQHAPLSSTGCEVSRDHKVSQDAPHSQLNHSAAPGAFARSVAPLAMRDPHPNSGEMTVNLSAGAFAPPTLIDLPHSTATPCPVIAFAMTHGVQHLDSGLQPTPMRAHSAPSLGSAGKHSCPKALADGSPLVAVVCGRTTPTRGAGNLSGTKFLEAREPLEDLRDDPSNGWSFVPGPASNAIAAVFSAGKLLLQTQHPAARSAATKGPCLPFEVPHPKQTINCCGAGNRQNTKWQMRELLGAGTKTTLRRLCAATIRTAAEVRAVFCREASFINSHNGPPSWRTPSIQSP